MNREPWLTLFFLPRLGLIELRLAFLDWQCRRVDAGKHPLGLLWFRKWCAYLWGRAVLPFLLAKRTWLRWRLARFPRQ